MKEEEALCKLEKQLRSYLAELLPEGSEVCDEAVLVVEKETPFFINEKFDTNLTRIYLGKWFTRCYTFVSGVGLDPVRLPDGTIHNLPHELAKALAYGANNTLEWVTRHSGKEWGVRYSRPRIVGTVKELHSEFYYELRRKEENG